MLLGIFIVFYHIILFDNYIIGYEDAVLIFDGRSDWEYQQQNESANGE